MYATFNGLFVQDNPNEYTVSISIFVYTFKALVLLASPIGFFQGSIYGFLASIQPAVFFEVFFHFLALSFPVIILFKSLQNPFEENRGINVDNLISNTELTLFQNMRVLWNF